ncbi:MAG: hypothetical protein ABI467_05760 [Kofleriaceae bacterium]
MFAVALASLSLAACGGGGDDAITPEGAHYHYVVNKALVPTNNNESREYGLDLNNDGTPDNQLGMVLGTLAGMGFDIQATIDTAVLKGSINLLVDVQTADATFMSSAATGLAVYIGSDPQPVACMTGEDVTCTTAKPAVCTGCGHQLSPTGGTFTAAPNQDSALAGKIVGGTFTGGPGDLSIQIAIGGTNPIPLNLLGARVKATGLTDANIGTVSGATVSGGAVLAGAITQDDINNNIIPAVVNQLTPTITRDCTMLTSPPGCGCADGSTGKTIIGLFDTSPADCMVTVDEVKSNSLIKSLLAPDVTIDGKMALSLGIKVAAEKATFTVAGETM